MRLSLKLFCFLISFVISFQVFIFSTVSNTFACTCSMGASRVAYVVAGTCPAGNSCTCNGSTLACTETPISAATCTGAGGVPTSSNPCCVGLTIEPRSGTCMTNPDCKTRDDSCTAGDVLCDPSVTECIGGKVIGATPTGGFTSNDQSPYCNGKIEDGVYTPFGCIKTTQTEAISSILKVSVSLGGGIALLLMLYGAFTISISAGEPNKVTLGKDIIISAISGLIFILFSVIILNFIGIKILALPGLM